MSLFSKKEKPQEKQVEPEKDGYTAYLERVAQSEARELRLAKMHCAESEKNRRRNT